MMENDMEEPKQYSISNINTDFVGPVLIIKIINTILINKNKN